ncbi:unnamed protein product [Rhizophagus irregularis]|uniref:CCHC-type domain-containing protein n=1 Tax=Rhizophagus irregularis TaxID=588596 RepID=A0A2I1H2H3_9GLOM|nr:hypothetical protein RhiirA4_471044 [Rhizophagus irregularis]CAB4438145.1 unnamed protein product [Rhizophagus irregularis]
MESNFAKFHINMIPERWYKEHLQSDLTKINNSPAVTLGSEHNVHDVNKSERDQLIDVDFTQTNIFNQRYQSLTIQRQAFFKKKSAEINGKIVFEVNGRVYATNEINEPLEHIARGRPANKRVKSSIEISGKRSGNISGKENANKKEYVCSKCKEIGHNARTCKK